MTPPTTDSAEPFWNLENRLTTALLILAGFVGASAYTHSMGYFVTFMTGNTERAVIGSFLGDYVLAAGAGGLIVCFFAGVVIASICRRHLWLNHPHGATVLATAALMLAATVDSALYWHDHDLGLVPILFVSFAMGALNTSFVKNGEVATPVTYVTGTLVKFAQGVERHLAGGTYREWLGYAVQYASFATGALIGGLVALIIDGRDMLYAAVAGSVLVSAYTWRVDMRWTRKQLRDAESA